MNPLQLARATAIATALFFSSTGLTKTFSNAYVSFDLPDRWDCHLEGTEWVCNSQLKGNSREAIIVLTAKEVGPKDTFEAYELYLKTPRVTPGDKSQPVKSEVKHVRRRKIAGFDWVDAMHLNSEIPSYYTRYLATVKDRLAILVTFSAHQKHFTKYSTDFFKAVESLRVVAAKDLFEPTQLAPIRPGTETIGMAVPGPADSFLEEMPPPPSSGGSKAGKLLAIAVLIASIGAYILLKKRKKK
jgi:LPXTG-motif cell wall-anchored protein